MGFESVKNMKFTKVQMQFLKSKFPQIDEVEFQQEAIDYQPKKKVMKEVPEEERCVATKKDGNRCTKRFTKDGGDKCSIHSKLPNILSANEVPLVEKIKCVAMTKKNENCKKNAIEGGSMCSTHSKLPAPADETHSGHMLVV